MSPDGQRKPLAERAASPSQCAHLAERRGEGRELLHFWGRYQAARPSPAPRTPPSPPHPRPPGPASSAAAQDPPSCPAPHPLRCPPCPSPAPHLPPAASPFPTEKQKSPLKRRTGGFREVLNGIFLLAPRSFSFLCAPKRAAPSEAGAAWAAAPAQGTQRSEGWERGLGCQKRFLGSTSSKLSGTRGPDLVWGSQPGGTAVAPQRSRWAAGGTGTRGMLRAELSVPAS